MDNRTKTGQKKYCSKLCAKGSLAQRHILERVSVNFSGVVGERLE